MVFFVIPAYNEEENISHLLGSVEKKMCEIGLPYKIVIIDDGSKDGTSSLLQGYSADFPVVLLKHEVNRNVGQVFRTGFRYVIDHAKTGDVVITKESDNTGDLNLLPEMLDRLNNGSDIVLASCYAKGGKVLGATIDRVIMSRVVNSMMRLLFPVKGASTYSSFYRAHKVDVLKKAMSVYGEKLIEESGFTCMAEMLIKFSRLSMNISEIPMILRCDTRKGKSKMNKTRTILAYFRLIFKELKMLNLQQMSEENMSGY
ncbi:MAG: glycosyltransferase [Candidatus Omnitrophica bacterium]|nr:glycosyltransferase [Candidatus Omnitrophota bacterium]